MVSIGEKVFKFCKKLRSVRSYIKEPFSLKNEVFEDEIYRECILYIPKGTESLYSRFDGWREFLHIVEMSGDDEPDIPGAEKCKTPTISYKNGKLIFDCETEGAICSSSITDSDIASYKTNEVSLTATYNISVYATKEGFNKSDVVTATLCWIYADPQTEGITNSVANVRAKAVLIQSNGNVLSIHGAEEGEYINVYNASGNNVGSAFVSSDVTNISTSLNSGDIGIVKIGERSIKVVIK